LAAAPWSLSASGCRGSWPRAWAPGCAPSGASGTERRTFAVPPEPIRERRRAGVQGVRRDLVSASLRPPPDLPTPSLLGEQLGSGSAPARRCRVATLVAAGAEGNRVSSMNTIAGPRVRACSHRSRPVRPTPADEQLHETRARYGEERTAGLAATPGSGRVLPLPGGPGHQHAARSCAPRPVACRGRADSHHLATRSFTAASRPR